MWTSWGVIAASLAFTGTVLGAGPTGQPTPGGPVGGPPPGPVAGQPGGIDSGQSVTGQPGTVWTDVVVRVERDGKLTVTEKVTVPAGKSASRTAPLRLPTGDSDRVFTVLDPSVDGHGTASADADTFTVHLDAGESTIKYTVDGAVDKVGEREEVKWRVAGDWDVPLDAVNVSLLAPAEPASVSCKSGPVSSDGNCDNASMPTGEVHADTRGLPPADRVDLTVGFAPDAFPVTARYEEHWSLAAAFAFTPLSTVGLVVLLALLLGGFGVLWLARGRDQKALAGQVAPVDVLLTDSAGHVRFASPDGVLPGQVGTVIDEHVDVVDVTATVVDLAVRNYLWIEELGTNGRVNDWRIVRRNPADDHLRPYEQAVCTALFPNGREQVLLSELRTGKHLDLVGVRNAMYRDVVDKAWFTRRPDLDRNRWFWLGIGLVVLGAGLTVVLALTTQLALLGLAVVVGGGALTVGAGAMPARTGRGSALIQQMRGLREYLHAVRPSDIPAADREMVFSRSLPYAVVLGATDRWLHSFGSLDPADDGTPGLYWFGELHSGSDLQEFARHFPQFLHSLDGVIAHTHKLRGLHS